MKAIMAMSENRCIGKENKIPWYVPNDFKWFKEFTMGKKLILGKNTFDTLPLLKNRECFVIVKKEEFLDSYIENQYFVNKNGLTGKLITMEDLYMMELDKDPDVIVAGGAKTYTRLLPMIDEFYVTSISGSFQGDTFMPTFEHLFKTNEVIKEFDGHKVIKYSK